MSTDDREADSFKIFGFEIEKKTSFTSLAAFLLSVWGVSQAAYYYLQGSDPHLVLPDRVMLFVDACHARSYGEIINLVAPITVINKAKSDYSTVLRDVRIGFALGKKYTYDSEAYVSIGSSTLNKQGVVGCDQNRHLGYFIEELESVPIEVIAGGQSYTHLMMFVPSIPPCPDGGSTCYRRNYLKATTALAQLKQLAGSGSKLDIDITIKFDEDSEQTKTCTVLINDDVVSGLTSNRMIDAFCLVDH